MNNSNPTLRKAHKLLKQTVKKLGRPDLYFSAQIGVDSSKDADIVTYAALIGSPAEGLAPITIASLDKVDFIEKIKNFKDNKISKEDLEIAFHEAQVTLMNKAIERHQAEIEKIKNPVSEETSEPQEAEIVEDSETQA